VSFFDDLFLALRHIHCHVSKWTWHTKILSKQY